MGETATAAAVPDREGLKRAGIDLGIGVGSGLAAGAAGAATGLLATWIMLLFRYDTASLQAVVARVLVAAAFIAAGVVLASYDRITLPAGAGAIVGAVVGAVFGFFWGMVLGPAAGIVGAALSLTQIPPLTRREFNAYFYSPIAYVVGIVFLFFFGLFMFFDLMGARGAEASLTGAILGMSSFMLPILAPVLTMRLLAEEKRSGTMEVLMTAPVRDWEVVLAKFFASLSVFGTMLAPTLVHVLTLYLVSEKGPATAPLVGSYLGMVLTAALFLSLGVLASALSRDQIVAAMIGFGFCICIFLLGVLPAMAEGFGWFAENEAAREMLKGLSYREHIYEFAQGAISTKGIVYFLSLTVFTLFLSVRVVELRKWR